MTRARFGGQDEPFGSAGSTDLTALQHSGELIDAFAERRAVRPATHRTGPDEPDDPVVELLQALVSDVDGGAPPLRSRPVLPRAVRTQPVRARVDAIHAEPALRDVLRAEALPGEAATSAAATGAAGAGGAGASGAGAARANRGGSGRSARRPGRRGAHTLIALSVTATIFTMTGVAAAGGIISHAGPRIEAKRAPVMLPTPSDPRTPEGPGTGRPGGRPLVTAEPEDDTRRPARTPRTGGDGKVVVREDESEHDKDKPDGTRPADPSTTPTPTPPRPSPTPDPQEEGEDREDPDAGNVSPPGGRYANDQRVLGDGRRNLLA